MANKFADAANKFSSPKKEQAPMAKQAIDPGTNKPRDVTANDVVLDGRIVGTDPDPNVRAQLLREANEGTDRGAT